MTDVKLGRMFGSYYSAENHSLTDQTVLLALEHATKVKDGPVMGFKFYGNALHWMPKPLFTDEAWQHITYLGLSKNHLRRLPPEVGQLVKLTYLGVFDNEIEYLPSSLSNLVSLNSLMAEGNEPLPKQWRRNCHSHGETQQMVASLSAHFLLVEQRWQRCRQAACALLVLRKRRLSDMMLMAPREIVAMVAQLVWASRAGSEWSRRADVASSSDTQTKPL